MALRDLLRPARRWSDDDRQALVDELLAERFPLPEPTLSERHLAWSAALHERDRLQSVGRAAAAEIARLDAGQAAASRRDPGASRQLGYDYERLRAPHRARLAEVEAGLADLAATVDWSVLEAGEKAFAAAVAELRGPHDQLRLRVRREAVQEAEEAHRAARAAIDETAGYGELSEALRRAADLEASLLLARRALVTTEATVTGRRGRK